jgi:predicted transcriptional regulator
MTAKIREVKITEVDLEKLINQAGITRYRLCQLMNMDQAQLHRYVKGYVSMEVETWNKIKQALNDYKSQQ